jgi:hypothetical protein
LDQESIYSRSPLARSKGQNFLTALLRPRAYQVRAQSPLPGGLFTFEPDVREPSRVLLGYHERFGRMRQYDMSVKSLRTMR